MSDEEKAKRFSVYLPLDLRRRIEELAKAEGKTVNGIIVTICRQYLGDDEKTFSGRLALLEKKVSELEEAFRKMKGN